MTEQIFHKFFDDAAIFPPGLAPLDQAVREHLIRDHDEVAEKFVGPLVLTVDKIAPAAELAGNEHIDVNAVGSIASAGELEELMATLDNVTLTGAEFKMGDLPAVDAIAQAVQFKRAHPAVDVYVELAFADVTDSNLQALAEGGVQLKFRTGGITQDLFPTPEQVITVIAKALEHGLRFKFTAGLHRAIRYQDEKTGFQHFGFANIAAAIDALQRGQSQAEALELLQSTDRESIASTISTEDTRWRDAFISFGTCDVPEPTETLTQLGLMTEETFGRLKVK